MKFTTEKERLQHIADFEKCAISFTDSMKKDIPQDTSVIFETITHYDDDSESCETGDIYVAYIKQPHILTAVKVLDMLSQRKIVEAGFIVWDAMIIKSGSSPEIEQHKNKLGLCGRLGFMLEMNAADVKKN